MSVLGRAVLPAVLALALMVSGCGASESKKRSEQPENTDTAYRLAAASSVRIVSVGDIACPPGKPTTATTCQQGATAALAQKLNPGLVLTLGDHQYQNSTLSEFLGSYNKSWGALLPKTRPVIGNHEYKTSGASGYYSYFRGRQPGPPGYYRVTANGWQIYLLNSNCDKVNCSAQAGWLDRQMAAHPARCSIIAMHHPRYSSGFEHGNSRAVTPLWAAAYRRHNDIVLAGHDHDYERFKPMDPWGHVKPTRGMTSFVSGAGGKNLYRLGSRKRGSVYFQARTHGVLQLDLRAGSYSWAFRNIGGAVMDSGSRTCR